MQILSSQTQSLQRLSSYSIIVCTEDSFPALPSSRVTSFQLKRIHFSVKSTFAATLTLKWRQEADWLGGTAACGVNAWE